eukprot:TRINITY_DN5951_c0_g1_i12.p1 TRINITY_DN5951_c0_g1~~TRINITY_DN5951_c0_g1_i12.p1  ORF type:complete len:108 (-),score=7.19 TRINITY_DN5951_c0_g1_i12:1059-1382(-)
MGGKEGWNQSTWKGALHEYEPHRSTNHTMGLVKSIGESRACGCALSHNIGSIRMSQTPRCNLELARDRGLTHGFIFTKVTVQTLSNDTHLSSSKSITSSGSQCTSLS